MKLAIDGGTPVRDTQARPWPGWPVWDEREEQALLEVLRSGRWGIWDGSRGERFAETFARFQGAEYGVVNTNGTAALEIALRAAGLQMGDEVIVPPYTFIATASAVLMTNGVPVFADIDPDTYNLDPKAAEAAITPRTRAIIAVHIAGCPADMDALTALAYDNSLILIEDCCQAHAAEWGGRKVGSIGDMGAFSFQSSKNLNAGEGGIVVTNSREYYERCWSIVNVGRAIGGAWYDHPFLGSNYRMTEFQAALLEAQFTRLPEQTEHRWRNAQILNHRLADIPGIRPMKVDERVTVHACHLYVFRVDESAPGGMTRARFIEALNAEGVPCSAGYVPLYRNHLFRTHNTVAATRMDYAKLRLPVAERACDHEAVWLAQPMLLGTPEDVQDIVDAVAKVQRAAVG
ncbi:MAG: DegT/DnrJ/EryC1/StrS family aminotransferase [Armatimonadetes bacterium]|nr:DegT/DnrJ/EryC1/StrS family aminotransferase [Armatimonadota bacterium]